MRIVFECLNCGVHYLPPEDLTYPDGTRASPVWCSPCATVFGRLGVAEPPGAVAAALLAARQRAEQAPVERPETPDARPSRPARTSRARSGPGVSRNRLG